jgi:transcriptional regulator with XRE-family HTH domain
MIKSLRIAAGLTQDELAKKIGTTQERICMWERGKIKPSVDMLKKLSAAFGVKIEDLI